MFGVSLFRGILGQFMGQLGGDPSLLGGVSGVWSSQPLKYFGDG